MGQGTSITRKARPVNQRTRSRYGRDTYIEEHLENDDQPITYLRGPKPPAQEYATGKLGRKRHNNYTRRYGTTKRVEKPLQTYVVDFTRKNANRILGILENNPMSYIQNPQALQRDLLTTFSIETDVHIPVRIFERINEIPVLVIRLRWEPDVADTLEKIRDTNSSLKLLLLPPKDRTTYRDTLRQEINKIITKPTSAEDIDSETGTVVRIKEGRILNSNVEENTNTNIGRFAALPRGNSPSPSVIRIPSAEEQNSEEIIVMNNAPPPSPSPPPVRSAPPPRTWAKFFGLSGGRRSRRKHSNNHSRKTRKSRK